MKRHPSLVPYSQDHHKILVLAQVLKKDVPDYKGMPTDIAGKIKMVENYFQDIIRPHEDREEEYLFPEIKGKDPEIDQLIYELEKEHTEMGEMIQSLDPEKSMDNNLHELGKALERHVRKEERTLFQLIQEKIGEDILLRIKH